MTRLVIGTRGSALALAQAVLTRAELGRVMPELAVEQREFVTRGDRKLDLGLLQRGSGGGKGLFTKELEDALLAREIDVAVHSLKDLPARQPEGLQLTAVLERAPVGDVLVSRGDAAGLDGMPTRAIVGTSSVRRARQITWVRPDLRIEEWRGNVPTRLRKLDERADVSGIILAEAGLRRLGYAWDDGRLRVDGAEFWVRSLEEHLLPAIGQGAIALQTRAGDAEVNGVIAKLNHEPTWICAKAERELQRLLEGDCTLPVGVRTRIEGEDLEMSAILFEANDNTPRQASAKGSKMDPERVAAEVFRKL